MTTRFDSAAYDASFPTMPLAELCDRLRGKYPGGIQYGKAPLLEEAARRLELMRDYRNRDLDASSHRRENERRIRV